MAVVVSLMDSAFRVRVTGLCGVGWEQLRRELGGYLRIDDEQEAGDSPTPVVEIACRGGEQAYRRWTRITENIDYEVMRHPRWRRQRIGKRGRAGRWDVVFGTADGSIIACDQEARRIEVVHVEPRAGAQAVRRVIRDQVFVPWLEQSGALVVHSASVVDARGRGTLCVGDTGSGKTSLFLTALAMQESCRAVSSDRTAIVREGDRIRMIGIPGKMNVHAGSLYQFEQTRSLRTGGDRTELWTREGKRLFEWRDLFDLFGAEPAAGRRYVERIIFPTYGSGASVSESVEGDAFRSEFERQVITGKVGVGVCNWLGWYGPAGDGDDGIRRAVTRLGGVRLRWSSIDDLRAVLSA